MSRDLSGSPLKSRFSYRDLETGLSGSSILRLIDQRPLRRYTVNSYFCADYLAYENTWPTTWVENIIKVPQATQSFVQGSVAIALSGGLDSQVLALHLKRKGVALQAYTLRTQIPGYCEWPQVENFSREFSIPVEPIDESLQSFISALPEFLRAVETPIYNLHAVSKWLLAKRLREIGIESVLSGDGADQTFQNKSECDLLPLTQRSFELHGIRLITPFAEPSFLDLYQKFPTKDQLREFAIDLGIQPSKKVSALIRGVQGFESAKDCFSQTLQILRTEFQEQGLVECAESRELFAQRA